MSRSLTWGVDGKGRRHMYCPIAETCFGIMDNEQQLDFEERFCEWCEVEREKALEDRKAACHASRSATR